MTDNNTDDETEEPTFDIEVSDARAEDLAAIVGGLGLMVGQLVQAAQRGAPVEEKLDELGELNERILVENAEAARYMMLEAEVGDEIVGIADEEFLEQLGIVVKGGELYPAEDFDGEFTDIEVE